MPVYTYRCKDCKVCFEARHGMFFEGQRCKSCYSDNVFRVPSLSEITKREGSSQDRPGKIVDSYIKDVKEEVKKEKDKLKKEEI